MAAFMYGLRAPDTKRQYPRRFQYFLNFLQISGTLKEQRDSENSDAISTISDQLMKLMSEVNEMKKQS